MDGVTGSQAFDGLLDQYRDKVFRLACSLLGNEASAEDATQEIFLKIWKALPGFRGNRRFHLDLCYRPQYLPDAPPHRRRSAHVFAR